MRVAHVYKDFCPPARGGIERYVADIAAATAARGFTVEVHVAGVRRSRTDHLTDGVEVHRHHETARCLSSPIAGGLALAASRLDADIVHLHMPNPVGEIGALLNRGAPALVASFHAPVVRQRFLEPAYGPLRERVLGRCRTVLVSSTQMAAARELAGCTDRVWVLPYGVSPSLAPSKEPSRRLDRDDLRILFVGRLVYYKGLDILLHAIASVADRPVQLTIVGEGPLRGELEGLAATLGVQDRVHIAGAVDDQALLEIYRSHDVFVMPSGSRAETFGMAMCEAMAAGLPAVSTTVGTGTDWVNLNGVTGLVVRPGDPVELAEALRTLAGDSDLRTRLGCGARERASAEFSFEGHIDGLVAVYEALVDNAAGRPRCAR
jgi:glycosyltransferase involved in cell wall biosynthesis